MEFFYTLVAQSAVLAQLGLRMAKLGKETLL